MPSRFFALVTLIQTLSTGLAQQGGPALIGEEGFLTKCAVDFLDLTISSFATDSLRFHLVDGAPEKYHGYNISRVAGLVRDPLFKANQKTMLIAHGYTTQGYKAKDMIINAYLKKGGYNIILFDTLSLTRTDYLRSVRLTRYIGRRLGMILAQLSKLGLDISKLEIIAHSLGAHIIGFTSKTFKKYTGKVFPSIIGLDPAGPCFRQAPASERLDKTDADFVQIIHTNAGGYGIAKAIGHVDFYMNGGMRQAADDRLMPCLNLCSHGMVLEYWISAMKNPTGFVGVECKNVDEVNEQRCGGASRKTAVMGPNVDKTKRGIFYVKTTGKSPYLLGMKGALSINPCLKA